MICWMGNDIAKMSPPQLEDTEARLTELIDREENWLTSEERIFGYTPPPIPLRQMRLILAHVKEVKNVVGV